MRVTCHFLFPDITDPDSDEADEICELLTDLTTEWSRIWEGCHAYVDDAVCEEDANDTQ